MVKKISVFITILGLFFVGIPQYDVMAYETVNQTFGNVLYDLETQGQWNGYYVAKFEVEGNNYISHLASIMADFADVYGGKTSVFYISNFTLDLTNGFNTRLRVSAGDIMEFHAAGIKVLSPSFVFKDGVDILEILNDNFWFIRDNTDYMYNEGFNDGYDDGYNYGYDDGYIKGENDGYINGENDGYINGVAVGYDNGYNDGYNSGIMEGDATGFGALLATVFGGLGSLLGIEILPGIYIGAIIAVPLVFGIIFFILGKRKGD